MNMWKAGRGFGWSGHGGRWHGGRWGSHRPWLRGHHWGQPMPDPQVQMAQACLAQTVDPAVPQDGIMGPQTRQAIMTFQMQQQLPPSGMLDPNTVSALQTCQPPAPPPPPPPPQVQGPPPQTGSRHSQQQEAFLEDILGSIAGSLGPLGGLIGGLFKGGSQPGPPPQRGSRPSPQQEAFLGDILGSVAGPLGPIGGLIGGLFQGGSQPGPPPPPPPFGFPPPDFHDRWHRDRHERGRWRREMEGEFPFEPLFDFHPHDRSWDDRDRWRWRGDRGERWGRDRDGEVGEQEHVVRPVVERVVPGRPEIARPEIRRPEFVRHGFDFHVRDRFPARDRWGWNRDRRWFDRPWEGRDWGFALPRGGPQVAWAQSCLAQVLGSWVVQDGMMGPATQAAIRTFQEQQQLPATGVLDGPTVNALQAACGSPMPV